MRTIERTFTIHDYMLRGGRLCRLNVKYTCLAEGWVVYAETADIISITAVFGDWSEKDMTEKLRDDDVVIKYCEMDMKKAQKELLRMREEDR